VSGRRTKYVVLVIWLALLAGLAPLGSKLADVTDDQTESFLPKDAESTRVLRLIEKEFPGGQTVGGIVVYHRPGGLTARDRAKMLGDAARLREAAQGRKPKLKLVGQPQVPFAPGAPPELRKQLVSPKGDAAYSVIAVPDDNDKLADWGARVRKIVGNGDGGLKVYVTGSLGFSADFQEVFGSVDTKLLLATLLLVLVLLGAIYRSPIIALIPLVVVAVAYFAASGLIYLYAKSGVTVSQQSTTILVVLMLGVGTDYCLLLVSRYREELRGTEDKHDAMARAMRRVSPALLASGSTVVLAMLVLLVAKTGSVHSLGPVCAIGVALVLLAGLTLLPALLTIAGRTGFWPRRGMVVYDPEHHIVEREGIWRRIGDRVLQRPGLALLATVGVFGAFALGLLAYKEDFSTTGFFRTGTESVDGFKVLERSFPAGALAPTTVLLERQDGPVRPQDIALASERLKRIPGVAEVVPFPQRAAGGRLARIDVVFRDDPNKAAALDRIPAVRKAVRGVAPGVTGLVGAGTAISYDLNKTAARDAKLIVPIALAVIALILGILLAAVVAPVVLIGTVIASFFGTLGLSFVFFRYVDGQPGVDPSMPIFAFIFLVALGVDYTIFLMSRAREEARSHGTREGMLRALSATGPVITSAGVILAGTFSVLMTLPVTFAFDIGFMVAVGILLDTFVVRTIMVPAAVELIGDRIWWPSTPSGGAHALGEAPTAPEPDRERSPVGAALNVSEEPERP
jgi:RND superfamily putative drug exporter